MTFDEYWYDLIKRVHGRKEHLTGTEERLYRLTCISGETLTDGIEAYFERRFAEFESDMIALRDSGFTQIEADFRAARKIMFDESNLDEHFVEQVIDRLLEETEEVQPVLDELGTIYDRMIPRFEKLGRYRDEHGLKANLYSNQDP